VRRLVLTLLATLGAALLVALLLARPVMVSEDGTAAVSVYDGGAARPTFADVSRPGARFVPLGTNAPSDDRWVRLELQVPDREDHYVVEREEPIGEATFVDDRNGQPTEEHSGDRIPLELRPIPSLNASFEVPPAAVRGTPLYVHESGGAPAPYRVLTTADFYAEVGTVRIVVGLYLGVLLAVGVYHLLMFGVLGGVDLLAFGAYASTLALLELARTRYLDVLFPTTAVDPALAIGISWALSGIAGYAVFATFLRLPATQLRLDGALRATTAVLVVLALLSTLPHLHVLGALLAFVALAWLALALAGAVQAVRAGQRPAIFTLVAFGGLFVGLAAAQAKALWPSLPDLAGVGFEAGTAFGALTLALGIGERIRSANESRDLAQRAAIEDARSLNVAYARFVPREFLELLGRRDIRDVRLGDQVQTETTILFADVRSFTTLSETMSPSDTFGFLNGVLARIGPVVRAHDGIVDKFLGDAIMALFPGPDTAGAALRAALEIQRAADAINAERAQRGRAPIALGVGLHRGSTMLGTIGEAERMDGSVIGDTVNLASRVEGLTKRYGARILATEAVYATLPPDLAVLARPLGRVAVAGKRVGVALVEIADADPPALREVKAATRARFASAVAALSAGAFAQAEAGFAALASETPEDGPAAFLRDRAAALLAAGAPWDGVDTLLLK
jgi:class 3 adenylate cyclase